VGSDVVDALGEFEKIGDADLALVVLALDEYS